VFLIARLTLYPSEFFNKIDPAPSEPGLNQTIRMPGYPKGFAFIAVLNKMRYTPLATDALCPREHLMLLRKAISGWVDCKFTRDARWRSRRLTRTYRKRDRPTLVEGLEALEV
jgi:hypothetical protein